MVFLSRLYPFKVFKRCLPQVLLAPFLNTFSHFMFRILLQKYSASFFYFETLWPLYTDKVHWPQICEDTARRSVFLTHFGSVLYFIKATSHLICTANPMNSIYMKFIEKESLSPIYI